MRESAGKKQHRTVGFSLFAAISLILALTLSVVTQAADLTVTNDLTVPNAKLLSFQATNDYQVSHGAVTATGDTITIMAKGYEISESCSVQKPQVSKTTLTISTTEPLIKVTYQDSELGREVTSAVKNSEPLILEVVSPQGKDGVKERKLTITKIEVVKAETFNVTMLAPTPNDPAGYSDYMVNGQPFDPANNVVQASNLDGLPLAITTQGGYGFGGWVMVGTDGSQELICGDAVFTFTPAADCTIQPVLAPAVTGEGVFKVGNQTYPTWNEAFKAVPENGVVVLDKDYELPNTLEGNQLPTMGGEFVKRLPDGTIRYLVPKGVTLLIPFDQNGTCVKEPNPKELADSSYKQPTLFRKLSMTAGTQIVVEGGGIINVGSRHCSAQPNVGAPSGPYGQIDMAENSSIVLNPSGKLFAWGFITGNGSVTAENNADVYEMFQIKDWRGGTATSAMNSYPVFPFSQWYVQNIEVPLIVKAGGRETLLTTIYAARTQAGAPVDFIGPDRGLFRNKSGSVTKYYDPIEDRIHITVEGDPTTPNYLEPMIIKVHAFGLNITVDSKKYPLPLNSNLTLRISSGKILVNQDIVLLPGAQVVVDEGAELELLSGKKFYLHDRVDWVDRPHQADGTHGTYINNAKPLMPVTYSPSKHYTRTERDLADAQLDVNGVAHINGTLYTTTGGTQDKTQANVKRGVEGANIVSSQGTGEIFITTVDTSPTASVQQCTQKGSDVTLWYIPVISARLHNDAGRYGETTDTGAYTETVANSTYRYDVVSGKWYTGRSASFVVPLTDYEIYRQSHSGQDHPDALTATNAAGEPVVNKVTIQGKNYVVLKVVSGAESDTVTLPNFPATWTYDNALLVDATTLGQVTDASSGTGVIYGTIEGAQDVTIHIVNPNDTSKILKTYTQKFMEGAELSGYYSDQACTNLVTTLTPETTVLYTNDVVARVEQNAQVVEAYRSLADAVNAATPGQTVILMCDADIKEQLQPENNVTIQLMDQVGNGNIHFHVSFFDTPFINPGTLTIVGGNLENVVGRNVPAIDNPVGKTMTVNLAGGSINVHGMTTAPVVNNAGTMTLDMGGGSIVMDQPVSELTAASAVVENSGTMTLTSTGAKGTLTTDTPRSGITYAPTSFNGTETMAAVVRTTNGVLTVNNVALKQMAETKETTVGIVCSINGHIQSVTDTEITVPYGQAVYNLGGQIDAIQGCAMNSLHGIWNRNCRHGSNNGTANANNRFEVSFAETATINAITDTQITASSYHALWNGGKVGRIDGSSVLSATHQTIYNTNTWFYDTMYYQYKDEKAARTYMASNGRENLPTIEAVTGNAQVLTTGNHYAILNDGVINEISGNAKIEAKNHYAIQIRNGGYVGEISGNAALTSDYQTILISGQREHMRIDLYYGTEQSPEGIAGKLKQRNYEYGNVSAIGTISGDTAGTGVSIKSTGNYALYLDGGSVDTISGKTKFNAVSYAIQIAETGGNKTWQGNWNYDPAIAYPSDADVRQSYLEEYSSNLTDGRRIKCISGRDVLIEASNYPAMSVGGWIDEIKGGVMIKSNRAKDWGPCLTISGTQRTHTKVAATNEGQITEQGEHQNKYLTRYDRTYTYDAVNHPAGIGLMDGVKVISPSYYVIQNSGKIGTMRNCSIAGTSSVVRNEASGTRNGMYTTVQHYFGGTANSANWNDRLYDERTLQRYESQPARIDLIESCTVEATTGGSTINNAGSIGTITNSTITAKTDRAISSVEAVQMSFINNTYEANPNQYLKKDASGRWIFPESYQETRTYTPPVIENLGGGNTIRASTNAVINSGQLNQVGDPNAAVTVITATGDRAIYNYQGTISERVRTVKQDPHKGTDISGTNKDTYTYGASAVMGQVQNAEITAANYAILNGDGNGSYTNLRIGELGDGIIAKSTNKDSYAVKSNANATITLISGGDYKGGTADRAYAIASPDSQTYPSTSDQMILSKASRTVTRADSTTEDSFYFVTRNGFYIKFKPNGGTGTMPGSDENGEGYFVSLATPTDPPAVLNDVPQNSFNNEGREFKGWKIDANASEANITDNLPNNVTVEQLKTALKPVAPTIDAGTEIVLYAHWFDPNTKTYTVEFGKLDYEFTPTYAWNPHTLKYELTSQWKVIPDEGASPVVPAGQIRVSNQGSEPITAQFSFAPASNLNWPAAPGMTFMQGSMQSNDFVVPAKSEGADGILTVNATLAGTPPVGPNPVVTKAGTVTVTIQKNNPAAP